MSMIDWLKNKKTQPNQIIKCYNCGREFSGVTTYNSYCNVCKDIDIKISKLNYLEYKDLDGLILDKKILTMAYETKAISAKDFQQSLEIIDTILTSTLNILYMKCLKKYQIDKVKK